MTTPEQGKWLLVVEDDAYINTAYSAKFEHEGIVAKFAVDGDEALGLLRAEPMHPSVILLDLMLPKRNGFEVLEELKKDPALKDIPVIVLTNLGQETDAKRGLDLGAVEYLVKADTKIVDILERIKKYLA